MSDAQSTANKGQEGHSEDLLSARLAAVSDVLDELRQDEGEDDLVLGRDPANVAQPSLAQTIPVQSDFGANDEADDSIEQYMADLLARTNGGASNSGGSAAAPEQTLVLSEQAIEKAVEKTKAPEPPEQLEHMAEKRQQTNSEVRSNLSTMREVANLNARSAIETHSGRLMVRRAFAQIGIIALGLAVSFLLLQSVTSVGSKNYWPAVGATLLAFFGTFQYFRLTVQLKRNAQLRQNA